MSSTSNATRGRVSFLNSIKIGPKIYIGFGAVLAVVAAMGGFAVYQENKLGGEFTRYSEVAADTVLVGQFEVQIIDLQLRIREYLSASEDKARLASVEAEFKAAEAVIATAQPEFQNPARAKLVDQIEESMKDFHTGFGKVNQVLEAARELSQQGEILRGELEKFLGGLRAA